MTMIMIILPMQGVMENQYQKRRWESTTILCCHTDSQNTMRSWAQLLWYALEREIKQCAKISRICSKK